MAYFSKDFIQNKLLPQVDLAQLIGQYCDIKPVGDKFRCVCPFHQGKKPWLYVFRDRQHFKCFGCGANGDAIEFLELYKHISFSDAVWELIRFTGLTPEFDDDGQQAANSANSAKTGHSASSTAAPAITTNRDSSNPTLANTLPQSLYSEAAYDLAERACSFFSAQLSNYAPAMAYLQHQRQLSPDLIQYFGLGYAPNDFDYIQQICSNPTDWQICQELGLLRQTERGYSHAYAFFRDRVMLPLRDTKGRVIGFGARRLRDDINNPKYLNSPESSIFHKRQELYGLYECLQFNQQHPACIIVVEGYLDALALYQCGFTNVVAALGTTLTTEHFKLLRKYTSEVLICLDGDAAGREASWHALQVATPMLRYNFRVRTCFLPLPHDPDSLVRTSGVEAFVQCLQASCTYTEAIMLHVMEQHDPADMQQHEQLLNSVLAIAKAVPDYRTKQDILSTLSRLLQIDVPFLKQALSQTAADPAFCLRYH